MTVQELIACLQKEDPEAPVHFSYNYGDYWRTTVAPAVRKIEPGYVKDSPYHGMPRVVGCDDDESDRAVDVVLLG